MGRIEMAREWRLLVLVVHLAWVTADVQVYPEVDPFIVADFLDAEANFGIEVPKKGIMTMLVLAEPADACRPIQKPPDLPNATNYWAVLISRYNCSFEEKVLNAQNAYYDVAIVHNVDSNKLEIMNASHPDSINIISIFVTANAGRELKSKYLYDRGYIVMIAPNSSESILLNILIPCIIIISSLLIVMIGYMVVKCVKDYRRSRRRRLPWSSLNRIPTTRFRKNDPFEICAICLDDFVEGEKLRVLPCSHAYHSKCIDPWLTRNRRVCPMCKRKVFAAGETVESDDSSTADDDYTPLLRSRNRPITTYGGTRRVASTVPTGLGNGQRERDVLSNTGPSESAGPSNSNSSSGSEYHGSSDSNEVPWNDPVLVIDTIPAPGTAVPSDSHPSPGEESHESFRPDDEHHPSEDVHFEPHEHDYHDGDSHTYEI